MSKVVNLFRSYVFTNSNSRRIVNLTNVQTISLDNNRIGFVYESSDMWGNSSYGITFGNHKDALDEFKRIEELLGVNKFDSENKEGENKQ